MHKENSMDSIIAFLASNDTVFLATSDQGYPRVRPFQFQFEQDGRLWFCTAKDKEVYAQLVNDQRVELSCTGKNMTTLRLKGMARLDDDMGVKRRIMETNGLVRSLYGSAENPAFTVFSIDHGSAILFDFSGNPPRKFEF
jgi:uncharacterized pyridoxamine 5'-phosphate oxidase family protein